MDCLAATMKRANMPRFNKTLAAGLAALSTACCSTVEGRRELLASEIALLNIISDHDRGAISDDALSGLSNGTLLKSLAHLIKIARAVDVNSQQLSFAFQAFEQQVGLQSSACARRLDIGPQGQHIYRATPCAERWVVISDCFESQLDSSHSTGVDVAACLPELEGRL